MIVFIMGKTSTIESFFKRKIQHLEVHTTSSISDAETSIPTHQVPIIEACNLESQPRPSKSPKVGSKEFDISYLERDPGLRPQIWEYTVDQRDEVRWAYLKVGPYQFILREYPFSKEKHHHRFQSSWFKMHPSWLEYSPTKDAAFCLLCYLFNKLRGHSGLSIFTIEGFNKWKKVNDEKKCAFLTHVKKDPNSQHKISMRSCEDLMNYSRHISKVIEKQTSQQIANNRLRLKTTIDAIRWLVFQVCAFRGHDESVGSINRGNFIKMVNFWHVTMKKLLKLY